MFLYFALTMSWPIFLGLLNSELRQFKLSESADLTFQLLPRLLFPSKRGTRFNKLVKLFLIATWGYKRAEIKPYCTYVDQLAPGNVHYCTVYICILGWVIFGDSSFSEEGNSQKVLFVQWELCYDLWKQQQKVPV